MVDCPACAGPQALGGSCATCNGTTEVSREVFDAFMAERTAADLAHETLIEKLETLNLNEYEQQILQSYGLFLATN